MNSNFRKLFIVVLIFIAILAVGGIFAYSSLKDQFKPQEQQQKQEVILTLTQDIVILNVGDYFDASAYIKEAKDIYGNDIKDKVSILEDLSTAVEGEYNVVYILKVDNTATIEKRLKVVVNDNKGENGNEEN